MLLSGCAIIAVVLAVTTTGKDARKMECGSQRFPLKCPKGSMCVALRIKTPGKRRFSFRCDLQSNSWCADRCPEVNSRKFCLLRNLTHDIKCCNVSGCNLENTPLFAIIEERFAFIRGTNIVAILLIQLIILIFIIYPIVRAIYRDRLARKYFNTEYNIKLDSELPMKEGNIFENDQPETGEPLDGCLTFDEFAVVMKSMAEYRGNDEEMGVTTPPNKPTFSTYQVHESLGFDYAVITRTEQTKFESLLIRMIEQGPGFFNLEGAELYELLSEVSEVFRTENTLLEIPADVVVIGEIRGRYSDLLRWFQLYGYPPKRRYLFLGGIIDQTCAESVETLAFLSAYKITTPRHIFMIRGATEFFPFHIEKRFPRKMNTVLSAFITRICSEMPIAATIGNKILAVHSGISPKLKSLDAIRTIDRPPLKWNCQIAYDLILGLPSTTVQMYERIKGGRGHYFGEKAVEECALRLKMELIIRTRSAYEKGHFLFASRRLLTIWSSNCCGVKLATSLYIDPKLRISVHSMTPVIVKTIAADSVLNTIQSLEEVIEVDEKI